MSRTQTYTRYPFYVADNGATGGQNAITLPVGSHNKLETHGLSFFTLPTTTSTYLKWRGNKYIKGLVAAVPCRS